MDTVHPFDPVFDSEKLLEKTERENAEKDADEADLNRMFAFAVFTCDKTADPDVTKKSIAYLGVCGDPVQN